MNGSLNSLPLHSRRKGPDSAGTWTGIIQPDTEEPFVEMGLQDNQTPTTNKTRDPDLTDDTRATDTRKTTN